MSGADTCLTSQSPKISISSMVGEMVWVGRRVGVHRRADEPRSGIREARKAFQHDRGLFPAAEQTKIVPQQEDAVEGTQVVWQGENIGFPRVDSAILRHQHSPGRVIDTDDLMTLLRQDGGVTAGAAAYVEHSSRRQRTGGPLDHGPLGPRSEIG